MSAAIVMVFMLPISILAVGIWSGVAFSCGFLITYISYEVVHRRIHTHPPTGWYSRMVRKHHLYHHFGTPKLNHGVTSRFWDRVFGTFQAPEMVKVPARHAMSWAVDPSGELLPQYENDYVLVGKVTRDQMQKKNVTSKAVYHNEADREAAFSNQAPESSIQTGSTMR